ncbi:long-chain fatty acid--CoA ligase [Rhodococcus sp. G-MC3]|uniref:acyl-CoA synthetase n=1 Tax=Rhodococcus sp. G-MC3 TaxID=3046209 RepID=UPI0024BBB9F6|nr:long-chain fatty acid--CoA ligase [Rhodococcus sp. G-MC3]MDJ0396488.1 long-chain fatty acid--CoA ligase [Rhodococcus sp. G-MC3]
MNSPYRPGLATLSERRARMSADATALIYLGDELRYREVHNRVLNRADVLLESGVKPGDRVAYLGPNHPALVETMLAVVRVGAIFLPLNYRLSAPELEYQISDAGIGILFADRAMESTADSLTSLTDVRYIEWSADAVEPPAAPTPAAEVGGEDPAFVLYTSGTTGHPKGAILTHENLLWNSYNMLLDIDVSADEVALISAPMFHVAALDQLVLTVLLKGGTCVIAPKWDVDDTFDLIDRHRVTWMFGVTSMYAQLSQSPRWPDADLTSIRSVMSGGAPIPLRLIETYRIKGVTFCQGYGMTETAPGATFLGPRDAVRKAGSAGQQVMFDEVLIVDAEGNRAPSGSAGEVIVRGPNVTAGYWGNETATAASFTDGGWFHTGDIAYQDDEGYVFIVDRLKDMYISGGENVYPAEVENVLFQHPDVVECAVIGTSDNRWGEVGHAFVVITAESNLDQGTLSAFCSERLARYKVPKIVSFVPALPRTGSGKIRKQDLRSGVSLGAHSDFVTNTRKDSN